MHKAKSDILQSQTYTMEVVLATNDHMAFSSSTWSSWAGSPYDLQLVTKDGALGAHRGLLLPLFKPLGCLVQATGCCSPAQVILPDTSLVAMTAVRDLLYRGCCQLDMALLPEIIETLSLLGTNVTSSSFVVETKTLHTEDDLLKAPAIEKPSGSVKWSWDEVQLENVEGNFSGNAVEARMTGSSMMVEGMVFSNYEEMLASVNQWSCANLSPLTNCGFQNKSQINYFRCPHKLKGCKSRQSKSTGKRKSRWGLVEYADCPFHIKMKKNKSGSFTITKADTKHRGHEVSEAQFKKYRQKRPVASVQKNVLMLMQDKMEEVFEDEREDK